MKDRRVLYFVKYPEPGKVKTRLARTVGAERAAELYRELAERNFKLLRETAGSGFSLQVAYDPPESEERIQSWLAGASRFFPQKGDGLGERLRWAFDSAFGEGVRQVIALGSDTLGLKPELISKAFEELENSDVVLGPAKDGGYYLIGLARPEPKLFQGIPWSTERVLSETITRAKEAKLSYYLLTELEDLDEGVDSVILRRPCCLHPQAARTTKDP